MANAKIDKEQIIWKAYQLFREQGYHSTTMADIGLACGLLKGSIYHHFTSKEDLMQHVLRTVHQYLKENIYQLAHTDERVPARERMQTLLAGMTTFYFSEPGGCIMGNVSLETANSIPEFAPIIRDFFEDWISTFAHLLATKYDKTEARQLAEQAVQDIQGSIMLAIVFGDRKYFNATQQRVVELLN